MSPIKMQRLESGIRLVVEYIEALNSHNPEAILGLLSPECSFEPSMAAAPGESRLGKDAIRLYFEGLFSQRKDIHFSTEELLGFGHRCLMRWNCTWTDERGVPRNMRGADIIRERDDLIREILSYCKVEE